MSSNNKVNDTSSWFSGPEVAALFIDLVKQLKPESDRGAVIVAASLTDEALEQLIKARLVPTNGKDDELFESPYAPLSTLSAKIDFAYRVGVIRAQVKSSLHLLRKLRNDFSHSSGKLDFTSQKVQGRVRELFKLNSELLDSVLISTKETLESVEAIEVREALIRVSKKQSDIDQLLELLPWRGLFDIVTALNCAALIRLPCQVEAIESLEAND